MTQSAHYITESLRIILKQSKLPSEDPAAILPYEINTFRIFLRKPYPLTKNAPETGNRKPFSTGLIKQGFLLNSDALYDGNVSHEAAELLCRIPLEVHSI